MNNFTISRFYDFKRPQCSPHVDVKRAHTEERPYKLIMPVVLHFLLLAGGGQEGIVRHTLRFLRINPPQLPLSKREKRTSHVYFLLLAGAGSRLCLFCVCVDNVFNAEKFGFSVCLHYLCTIIWITRKRH